MTTEQLKLLKKFNLKETDIKEINVWYLEVWDWKSKHKEHTKMKHYICKCWQYTLLWLIDKLQWKCKDCFNS